VLIKPTADARYGSAEAVARARSRLGENRYRLTRNNCEHFCEWCIYGEPRSEQVERFLAAPLLSLLRRFAPIARHLAPDPVETAAGGCAG
jgi:Lecithin retinol acyltransferase